MIVMVVASPSEEESGYICICSRGLTGQLSDEKLEIHRCPSIMELEELIRTGERTDMACIDITVPDMLRLTEAFRSRNESAYIILIASLDISPVLYMKPGIHAESLILKPFHKEQAEAVLREAFSELLRRYQKPDREKMFVLDNQDGRILIEYDAICFFEARNKKIYLNTGKEEYGFYGTIEQLEQELGERFLRCHRSFLVNRGKIERTVLSRNLLLLEGGFEIPVSRTYRPVMRQLGGK